MLIFKIGLLLLLGIMMIVFDGLIVGGDCNELEKLSEQNNNDDDDSDDWGSNDDDDDDYDDDDGYVGLLRSRDQPGYKQHEEIEQAAGAARQCSADGTTCGGENDLVCCTGKCKTFGDYKRCNCATSGSDGGLCKKDSHCCQTNGVTYKCKKGACKEAK